MAKVGISIDDTQDAVGERDPSLSWATRDVGATVPAEEVAPTEAVIRDAFIPWAEPKAGVMVRDEEAEIPTIAPDTAYVEKNPIGLSWAQRNVAETAAIPMFGELGSMADMADRQSNEFWQRNILGFIGGIDATVSDAITIFAETQWLQGPTMLASLQDENILEVDNRWFPELRDEIAEWGREKSEYFRDAQSQVLAPLYDGGPTQYLTQLVQGGASALTALGIFAVTKNPTTAASALGMMETSHVYQDALDAGKTKDEALGLTALSLVGVTVLERVGIGLWFKDIGVKLIPGLFIKGMGEATQEASQQLFQNLVAKYGYDETREWYMGLWESMSVAFPIGVLVPGGIQITSSLSMQIRNWKAEQAKNIVEETEMPQGKAEALVDGMVDFTQEKLKEFENYTRKYGQATSLENANFTQGVADKETGTTPAIIQETEARLKTQQGQETLKDLSARVFDDPLIGTIERAVGEKQAQIFKVTRPWEDITLELEKKNIDIKEDAKALFNYFDNPQKYELSPELKKVVGLELLQRVLDYKVLLTQEQVSRGLLESTINDEEYMRTFLEQTDGSEPSASQLEELSRASTTSILKRLMGINTKIGVSGLSTKNRYNQLRKFKNADERDVYLRQFGLRTNRNFFEVMARTAKQVSSITSNYDFIFSLRAQAKKGLPGVVEIYDPEIFKKFKEDRFNEYKKIRDAILIKARNQKKITEVEYKEARGNTKQYLDGIKQEIKLDFDTPADMRKFTMRNLDYEFRVIRESLFEDMREQKRVLTKMAKNKVLAVRERTEKQIIKEVDRIAEKYAKFKDEGFRRPKDLVVAQKLTGLMFDEATTNALGRVYEKLKPSNIDDLVRGFKLMMATGDLFQLPEVVRQKYATGGVNGLLGQWGYSQGQFYEEGIDAIRHGLILGRPMDIDIDIIKRLGKDFKTEEESFVARTSGKVSRVIEKVPLVGRVVGGVKRGFQALEDFQWRWVVPQVKLVMYKQIWPKFRKLYPQLTEEQSKVAASRFINSTFQGINWERVMSQTTGVGKFVNQRRLRAARLTFFGPDRLTSIVTRYTKAFGKYGKPYRRMIFRQAVAGVTLLEILNIAFNGHWSWENEKGNEFELQFPFFKDEKGNPMSINILGTWIEPLKFIDKPLRTSLNKLGLIPRVVGVGVKSYYTPETFREFVWEHTPIPFSLRTIAEYFTQDTGKKITGETDFQTALKQAALEFGGLPAVYRSGRNKDARFMDLVRGNATLWEWLTSREITQGGGTTKATTSPFTGGSSRVNPFK